jgi:hypothetical protein
VTQTGTCEGSVLVHLPQTYVVGDTYEYFVEMESVCSARVRSALFQGFDMNSEARFECTGDGSISAADDWTTWKIRLRSN